MQCDELWSFVDNKGNKQWVWLVLDADTREIVGVSIGARDQTAAQQLWASLPPVYRQCAVAYTDFWTAYAVVFPSKRHQAVGKETGLTSYQAVQQYLTAAGFSISAENLIVLSTTPCCKPTNNADLILPHFYKSRTRPLMSSNPTETVLLYRYLLFRLRSR